MKAASIAEIRKELKEATPTQLIGLCLRLARYKKENKELLTFLLFESGDMEGYIGTVKSEIDESFTQINTTNLYWAKKGLRKILRSVTKYIRYTGSKEAETDLLLYFCTKLKESAIPIHKNTGLVHLYQGQLKKIDTVIASLHEDLQHDYLAKLASLKEA